MSMTVLAVAVRPWKACGALGSGTEKVASIAIPSMFIILPKKAMVPA
jgi:hypothetical protein